VLGMIEKVARSPEALAGMVGGFCSWANDPLSILNDHTLLCFVPGLCEGKYRYKAGQ
jgi:hypothetical protein